MATALPRWVITAIVIFGVRMDMLRRDAVVDVNNGDARANAKMAL
jgi:hypothetical protein